MSPLTKIFVVLLVVSSMLLTASTVVFVVKAKPLQTQLDEMKMQRDTKIAEAAAAQVAQAQADARTKGALADGEAQRKALASVIGDKQAMISGLQTQLATNNAEKAARDQQIAQLTQQVAWLVAAETKNEETIKITRDLNQKLVKQQEDDSKLIAEKTSLADVSKAQAENVTEQYAKAQDENQKLKAFIKGRGLPLDEVLGGNFVPVGLGQPAINGMVTEKKEFNGMTYVTLNVGTVDGVQVGTEFNILDRAGHFLGFAKIEHVDNNVSIGKFNGAADKAGQLQASDEAKTQIRGS